MKEQNPIKITELGKESGAAEQDEEKYKMQNIKKYLIFFLMGIVCFGCLYMIFSPPGKDQIKEKQGINEVVPMATVDAMQDDKGKAYEKEAMEKKRQEEQSSLTALSDYWNNENQPPASTTKVTTPLPNGQEEAVSSYRNVQHTLGNFYVKDDDQSNQLREEVRSLRSQLAQKETKSADPVASQIALMEKSYQLAAKYLPANGKSAQPEPSAVRDTAVSAKKTHGQPVHTASLQIVSALYRKPSDSVFLKSLSSGFHTVGQQANNNMGANSIKACVAVSQKITDESPVRLRLLQDARLKQMLIPKGTLFVARAKFQVARLQLLVTSVEFRGNILPVELTAYDMDGQQGLTLPYSPERSALTEVVANMGNSGGTSISLSSNTKQQLTSDLSKCLIQGVSGYFSKKVRMPQVTLKAGLEVYLVSKK